MKKLIMPATALFLSFALSYCGDGGGPGGGPCDELEDKMISCLDDYCSAKTCGPCRCWKDGHKAYDADTDQCYTPTDDEQPSDEECKQMLDQFNCDELKSAFDFICQ